VLTKELVDTLQLEPIGDGRFRGHSAQHPGGVVEAGQLMGQSMVAALAGQEGKAIKTLHIVLARAAKLADPVELTVEQLHSGRAFASSTVTISQGDRLCARASILLSADEPDLVSYAEPGPGLTPPDVPGNGEWQSETVGDVDLVEPTAVGPAELDVWSRFDGAPDDLVTSQSLLAYASNLYLIGTAMRPHDTLGYAVAHRTVSTGVIDHTITFHEPFSAGEWLLLRNRSPYAGRGRTYGRGDVFTADGQLVASFVQDNMIRALPEGHAGTLCTASKSGIVRRQPALILPRPHVTSVTVSCASRT
jgi:acyl-CoA thioesterase